MNSSGHLTLLTEAPICRLDKHGSRPGAAVRTVQSIIIHRGFSRLYLLQGHAPLNHVLNAVAHNGDHIPVVGHISNVADTAVARNHPCAALRPKLGDGEIENLVQPVENPVEVAPLIELRWE